MFTPTIAALLLAFPVANPRCLPGVQPDPAAIRQHKPLVQWIGEDSARDVPGTLLVTTPEGWVRLWAEHRSAAGDDPARPWVDFDQVAVLALFAGRTTQCRGEGVYAIDEFEDHVRVRCWSMTYGVGLGPGADVEKLTRPVNPFGMFVLPRIDKPIVIERRLYEHKLAPGEPEPAWTEVTRFNSRPS